MNKINLGKIENLTTTPCLDGNLPKFWIQKGGKSFLFKENYNSCGEGISRTDFGEVLYSKICHKLNLPCVKSRFAYYINEHNEKVDGVLIDNFLNTKEEFSVNYLDIINSSYNGTIKLNDYGNVQFLGKVLKRYCLVENYKFSIKKTNTQLIRQSILDYFLMQDDRNISNIEFIGNQNELRLSPVFDNGFCLGFASSDETNKKILNNLMTNQYYDLNRGFKMTIFEKTQPLPNGIDYLSEIVEVAKNSLPSRIFIKKLLDIDMELTLKQLEGDCGEKLDKTTFDVSVKLFERKKELFKKRYIKNNEESMNK